jgi:hypothetical protein
LNKTELLNIIRELEIEKEKLFGRILYSDKSLLYLQKSKATWSIIQIIQHLIKSEQLTIVYIKRAISRNELTKSGILSRFRGIVLVTALKSNLKFKAPSNVSNIPNSGEVMELKLKWDRIRKDLIKIVEESNEETLNKDVFNHPSAGKMNLEYTLKFMKAHIKHHNKQIEMIL